MEDRIFPGCHVDIYFVAADAEFDVEVLYVPVATGDSWVIKRKDGMIINVQLFEKMIRTWDGKE